MHRLAILLLLSSVSPLAAQNGPPGGGFGGPRQEDTKVLEQFDADKNGQLDAAERQEATAWLATNRPARGRGMGGRGEMGAAPTTTASKGQTVSPTDTATYPKADVWDPDVVRTIFVTFPEENWFAELTAFYRTDVLLGAKVEIDGQSFANVGMGFRGNTSFQMVRGKKKSWDLQFDWLDAKQSWRGVRNLDLINANGDPSYLREMVHGWVANQFFAAPRVALVRLVVNGEDFGIYSAVQQFDKAFLEDHFQSSKGTRWKVPPDFSGNGGLRYLGDEPDDYKRSYQIKSKDDPRAWLALVDLCGALEFASAESLPEVLPQHLDIDSALWFLAVDHVLADDDGYFSRASDYCLYRDGRGKFHLVPRDNNEILATHGGRRGGPAGAAPGAAPGAGPLGPGAGPGRGGPGGGVASTPLQGAERADRPLLKKMLAVPAWRDQYLANVRKLLTGPLASETIGKRVESWRRMIDGVVEHDAHSPFGYEAFTRSFASDATGAPGPGSLLFAIAQRRTAILAAPEMHKK